MNIQKKVNQLFESQLLNWDLARRNFSDLNSVRTKTVDFDNFSVHVQFNPGRMVSSGAKLDAKTLANRNCFLCASNRPEQQQAVAFGDYSILVNPFPIFPRHFTIPRNEHVVQSIRPYFKDMLLLAQSLPELIVFYNGQKCGASAPDHMHFQAGSNAFLPLLGDYQRLKIPFNGFGEVPVGSELFTIPNYLRTVFCIESSSSEISAELFGIIYNQLQHGEEEPMMNLVCFYERKKWYTFILPRGQFRPWQYTAEEPNRLLVSPGTVEMCGVFITPILAHFERINRADVIDILTQSTLKF